MCTSFVKVNDIDLGDCAIGSSTKGELEICNLSDLPCKIKLEFQSKILKLVDPSLSSLSVRDHILEYEYTF